MKNAILAAYFVSLAAICNNDTMVCNGYKALCDMPYNEVSFPSSHNSMSNQEKDWFPPDHLFGLTRQMQDGIRGLVLDVFFYKHSIYMCHAHCEMGSKSFFEGLLEVKDFMEANPNEIFAFFIETYVPNKAIADMIVDAGLGKYVYTHDFDSGWPTLREMIQSGQRLIVMTDRGGFNDTPEWMYHEHDLSYITSWDIARKEDFSCEASSFLQHPEKLYVLNHYLLAPFTLQAISETVNYDVLRNRMWQCYNETGHIPNFPSITFYSRSDLFSVVNELNEYAIANFNSTN